MINIKAEINSLVSEINSEQTLINEPLDLIAEIASELTLAIGLDGLNVKVNRSKTDSDTFHLVIGSSVILSFKSSYGYPVNVSSPLYILREVNCTSKEALTDNIMAFLKLDRIKNEIKKEITYFKASSIIDQTRPKRPIPGGGVTLC